MDNKLKLNNLVNKLKLGYTSNILEVLDFNGVARLADGTSAYVDVSGNRRITFDFWIDSTTALASKDIISFKDMNPVGNNALYIYTDASPNIVVRAGATDTQLKRFNLINAPLNRLLSFDIKRQAGNVIEYLKINGETQTALTAVNPGGATTGIKIGEGLLGNILDGASIWNIKIYNSDTGTLLHNFPGTPNPEQKESWYDTVGTVDDFEFNVSDEPSTRIISTYGAGSNPFNKLILNGESQSRYGYGLLYNWYAVNDASYIYAAGWHVATIDEYANFVLAYNPTGTYANNTAGEAAKETGYTYWNSPNTGALNAYSFNVRGAGYRDGETIGTFQLKNAYTEIWSSTQLDTTSAWVSYLNNDTSVFYTRIAGSGFSRDKRQGNSVRLVKDTTSLTHGQSSTYTGNDGRIYRTICVSTKEWLADNLCETKYRDGTPIPEVTDNTQWTTLSTGALCAYDNDWKYV